MTRKTILVVEDEVEVAALVEDLLTTVGHRVLTAGTAEEALRIAHAFRVHLLLLDTLPPHPGQDRWSALEPIVAAACDAPVILCSADDPQEYADYAAHGCAAFLAKPFDFDALGALVASLLPDAERGIAQGGGHAPEQVI